MGFAVRGKRGSDSTDRVEIGDGSCAKGGGSRRGWLRMTSRKVQHGAAMQGMK